MTPLLYYFIGYSYDYMISLHILFRYFLHVTETSECSDIAKPYLIFNSIYRRARAKHTKSYYGN